MDVASTPFAKKNSRTVRRSTQKWGVDRLIHTPRKRTRAPQRVCRFTSAKQRTCQAIEVATRALAANYPLSASPSFTRTPVRKIEFS